MPHLIQAKLFKSSVFGPDTPRIPEGRIIRVICRSSTPSFTTAILEELGNPHAHLPLLPNYVFL